VSDIPCSPRIILTVCPAGILVFGVGLQLNGTACAAGIYLCILFYTSSKVLIYLFLSACFFHPAALDAHSFCRLAEKVYVVWNTNCSRLRSPVYIICIVTVALYSAVVLVMFLGRIERFREVDGACELFLPHPLCASDWSSSGVLGLKPTASIPLLTYDL
jgi:hypothetical protein